MRGRHDQAGWQGSRSGLSPVGCRGSMAGRSRSRCWGCSSYGNIRRQMQPVCQRGSVSRGQLGAFLCPPPQGGSGAVHHPWAPRQQGSAPAGTSASYWHVLRPGSLTAAKCVSCALSPIPGIPKLSKASAAEHLASSEAPVCHMVRGSSAGSHGRVSIPPPHAHVPWGWGLKSPMSWLSMSCCSWHKPPGTCGV